MRLIEKLAEAANIGFRNWWFDKESRGIVKLTLFTLQMCYIFVVSSIVATVLMLYIGVIWLLLNKDEYEERTAFMHEPL